jgi:hypothetical protein
MPHPAPNSKFNWTNWFQNIDSFRHHFVGKNIYHFAGQTLLTGSDKPWPAVANVKSCWEGCRHKSSPYSASWPQCSSIQNPQLHNPCKQVRSSRWPSGGFILVNILDTDTDILRTLTVADEANFLWPFRGTAINRISDSVAMNNHVQWWQNLNTVWT